MSSLTLWFSDERKPELTRVVYITDSQEQINSVRGKTSGAFLGERSFQWSSAVHALSLFFVRAAAGLVEPKTGIILEGESSSPASSLDFALSKQPLWLAEMFGYDVSGKSLLRNLILRTNPNRKRRGPVSLSLNERRLKSANIRLYLGQNQLGDTQTIITLAKNLEEGWTHSKPVSPKVDFSEKSDGRAGVWEKIVRREVSVMIRSANIFDQRALRQTVERISKNPSFIKIAGSKVDFLNSCERNNSAASRLGMSQGEKELISSLSDSEPLRFSIPISAVGTIAVLSYLKYIKRYPIEIDLQHPHTLELRRRILKEDFFNRPDACVLGSAPAAALLRKDQKTDYVPFMLMPPGSQRVVTPLKTDPNLNQGRYFYMKEEPSTSSFFFDDLVRAQKIDLKKVQAQHLEPEEALLRLREEEKDFRAILFYPYAELFQELDICKAAEQIPSYLGNSDLILFVRRELLADKRRSKFLNVSIRNAWLTLLEEPQIFDQIVKLTAEDTEYRKCVRRFAGLHMLSQESYRLSNLI